MSACWLRALNEFGFDRIDRLKMMLHKMIHDPAQRLFLCDVPVDPATPERLTRAIVDWSGRRSPTGEVSPVHVSYVNAHVHNLARGNQQLRAALRDTSLCYADGTSIVWACRGHGEKIPPRLTAADFFPDVIATLTDAGRRVFLLGSADGVAQRAVHVLQRSVPHFCPAGMLSGYFDLDDSPSVIRAVQAASPDVLVVGMGTPRQELWVHDHLTTLNVPVVWTVGALLDYIAGLERRCPKWMGDMGLEWFHRFLMHPRRRALRYLIGNPNFMAATMLGKLEKLTTG